MISSRNSLATAILTTKEAPTIVTGTGTNVNAVTNQISRMNSTGTNLQDNLKYNLSVSVRKNKEFDEYRLNNSDANSKKHLKDEEKENNHSFLGMKKKPPFQKSLNTSKSYNNSSKSTKSYRTPNSGSNSSDYIRDSINKAKIDIMQDAGFVNDFLLYAKK